MIEDATGIEQRLFVVIDRAIVWTGSFNFTFAARKNYENLIRMEGGRVGRDFTQEAMELFREVPLWDSNTQLAATYDGTFRCGTCEKIKVSDEQGQDNGTWMQCRDCQRAAQRSRR